jgi:dTDP-4-amino-4,6-dideoxygalactose transaminase
MARPPVIYFSRHLPAPDEIELVRQALEAGHGSGDGTFTARARERRSELHAGAPVLLTTSCTHALELAALALGLGPEDEVVMPSFTFPSTANAFALRGCTLRFADIEPETLSMELPQLRAALTPRTRLVVTVAYGGVMRDPEALAAECKARGIHLVEDNAHGLFAKFRGRALGTFGDLSALSFHATKNISMGEGGALVLNRRELLERAEILREKGTNRARFLRGQVDKYTWQGLGSSYLPSDILAAVLVAQLEHATISQARRLRIWNIYREAFEPQVGRLGVGLQAIPSGCSHPAHVFVVLLPEKRVDRSALLSRLWERGVTAVSHYEPLHLAPGCRSTTESLPTTESIAPRLVRLPLYAGLSDEDAQTVVRAFMEELERALRS